MSRADSAHVGLGLGPNGRCDGHRPPTNRIPESPPTRHEGPDRPSEEPETQTPQPTARPPTTSELDSGPPVGAVDLTLEVTPAGSQNLGFRGHVKDDEWTSGKKWKSWASFSEAQKRYREERVKIPPSSPVASSSFKWKKRKILVGRVAGWSSDLPR